MSNSEISNLEAKLSVRILEYTPNPEQIVAAAARLTQSSSTIEELLLKVSEKEQSRLITTLIEMGHLSPFEHVVYTFGIEGISRACSHQLVRHRIASYSQQSQRYVSYENVKFVVPPEIARNSEDKLKFLTQCLKEFEVYLEFVNKGYKPEDARFLLPNATETKIIITMNARELLHFYELRTCERAQWEIRQMAKQMLTLSYNTAPNIFKNAGPRCLRGPCTEGKYKCERNISEIRSEFEKIKR
ncbi:MAG: FAD-dependent thymidylate synthase [Candidatus Woesearchaeota archaeon]